MPDHNDARHTARLCCAALLAALPLSAQSAPSPATLLKDIGIDRAVDGSPDDFTRLGPWTYFVAGNFLENRTLWRTGGTSASTSAVLDLSDRPGGGPIDGLARAGGKLFLRTNTSSGALGLWVSDGTAAGTSRVPVSSGLRPDFDLAADLNGRLFTYARNGAAIVTDGTPAGTTQLAVPDLNSIVAGPTDDGSGRERLWFAAGPELWETDGTAAGTQRIAVRTMSFVTGVATGPFHIAVHLLDTMSEAIELLDTRTGRATASITLPTDTVQRPGGVIPLGTGPGGVFTIVSGRWRATPDAIAIAAVGNSLLPIRLPGSSGDRFFLAGMIGQTLWLIDTTGQIARLDPGQLTARVIGTALQPIVDHGFIVVRDRIYYDTVYAGHQLIELDTRSGAARSVFLSRYPRRPITSPRLAAHFGRVLFASGTEPYGVGFEPHVHDPVAGTTAVLADTATGSESNSAPRGFARFGDRVTFVATRDVQTEETWITDGTPAGTRAIAGLGEGMTYAEVGSELWVTVYGPPGQPTTVLATDGSSVRQVAALASQASFSAAAGLGNRLVLAGRVGNRSGFFAVDNAGSLAFLAPAIPSRQVIAVGGHAYLIGYESAAGQHAVWLTDGTAAGTRRLGAVPGGAVTGFGIDAVAFDDRLFVVTSNGVYVADPAGGIAPFPAIPAARLYAAEERLYGLASNTLYVTDGTAANTVSVPLPGQARALGGAALGDRLLFTVDRRPWVSDGTAGGTAQLLPLLVDGQWAVTGPDRAFCVLPGAALVVTDGTPAGTSVHQQIPIVGSWQNGGRPTLLARNGRVFLVVDDPAVGREPFVLDPDAAAEVVGSPCAADPSRIPTIWVGASPAVGGTAVARARSTGSTAAVFALGIPALRPQPLLGGRCALHVDPGGAATFARPTGPGGATSLPLVVPPSPALRGVRLMLQAVLLQPNGDLDATAGVLLQVGG